MLLFFLDAFFTVYVLTEWFIAVMIPCWLIVSPHMLKKNMQNNEVSVMYFIDQILKDFEFMLCFVLCCLKIILNDPLG